MDYIELASSLGRLDFVSALLASISIALALSGVVAFLNLKHTAREAAKEAAADVAKDVALNRTEELVTEVAEKIVKENLPGALQKAIELEKIDLEHKAGEILDDPSTIVDDGSDNKLDDNN